MSNSTTSKKLENLQSTEEIPSAILKAHEHLAEELEREKDRRLEERFLWILVVTLVVDVIVFSNVTHVGGSIVIGVIQILALLILARRMGIEEVSAYIDKLVQFGNGIK